jgi:hypothetical protein
MLSIFSLACLGLAAAVFAQEPAQNIITGYRVQNFQSFIRVSVKMERAPVYRTSPAFASRQPVRGELQFHFSKTLLDPWGRTPYDSLVHVELQAFTAEEFVVLRIRHDKPFRFNTFYFAPDKNFIIDMLPDRVEEEAASVVTPLDRAKGALARRDTSQALLLLQRIIAASPMEPGANYELGLIRMERGDLEMARQNFLRAAKSDSTFHNRVRKKLETIDKKLKDVVFKAAHGDSTIAERQSDNAVFTSSASAQEEAAVRVADDSVAAQTVTAFGNAGRGQTEDSLSISSMAAHEDKISSSPAESLWQTFLSSHFDVSSVARWISEQRTLLWRLSAAFAMLGITLVAGHMWSIRKFREPQAKPSPHEFASLLTNRLPSARVSFFDLESEQPSGATTLVDRQKKKNLEAPFTLPAPLPETMAGLPDAMTAVSEQELAGNRLETIARRFKVGQGELELYLYLSKRNAASRASSNQPRLTIVEAG